MHLEGRICNNIHHEVAQEITTSLFYGRSTYGGAFPGAMAGPLAHQIIVAVNLIGHRSSLVIFRTEGASGRVLRS